MNPTIPNQHPSALLFAALISELVSIHGNRTVTPAELEIIRRCAGTAEAVYEKRIEVKE